MALGSLPPSIRNVRPLEFGGVLLPDKVSRF